MRRLSAYIILHGIYEIHVHTKSLLKERYPSRNMTLLFPLNLNSRERRKKPKMIDKFNFHWVTKFDCTHINFIGHLTHT